MVRSIRCQSDKQRLHYRGMEMDECLSKDYISDLPDNIIDCILTKLPTRDAVQTSILSTKWRYQWATVEQLVFEKSDFYATPREKIFSFIKRCVFLHVGPINKFSLSDLWDEDKYPEIDQCLLYLSSKGLKELVLSIDCYLMEHVPSPSAIFSCHQLNSLTLEGFEVKPPLTFQGYPCLKYLTLRCVEVTPEVVENLISGCPLLEKFIFSSADELAFTIRASNLKHLILEGGCFDRIYLEHAPLLVTISIENDIEGCDNILLTAPVTLHCLRFIELRDVNFAEMIEMLSVLNLILQSPNLQELGIWAFEAPPHSEAAENFWERKCPPDFTFQHLKLFRMHMNMSKCTERVDFIKFVLGRSPALEVMRVTCDRLYGDEVENEVLHFQRVSPKVKVDIIF